MAFWRSELLDAAPVGGGTNPLFLAHLWCSQDVLSNFFGGLMLLLAEPFIPGDMVTFQRGGVR